MTLLEKIRAARAARAAQTQITSLDLLSSSLPNYWVPEPPRPTLPEVKEENKPEFLNEDNLEEPDENGISLDASQIAAIRGLKIQRYGCLIGAAGTGKTTCLKRLIQEILSTVGVHKTKEGEERISIAFCSYTGRAVQQMRKALGEEWRQYCDTIHGTLGYHPVYEDYFCPKTREYKSRRKFIPKYNAVNKLPHRFIIVDEAGMLPTKLWNELWAALIPGCRVIFIGDIQQLPPVGGRSTLGYAMNQWPVFGLEKVHRTNENAIIENAHKILNGKSPSAKKGIVGMKSIHASSSVAFQQVLGGIKSLYNAGRFDPEKDVIITGQNKGPLGQKELNKYLVSLFNPIRQDSLGNPLNERKIVRSGQFHYQFALGDKVMLTSNIRHLGLANGQMGKVVDIYPNPNFRGLQVEASDIENISLDALAEIRPGEQPSAEEEESERAASHCMTVAFFDSDQEFTFSTAGEFGSCVLAYAVTCHKMQGSEARRVVIICHSSQSRMVEREWLYTAVTRAQEAFILLSNPRGLNMALRKQRIKGNTIEEKAKAFIEKEEEKNNGNNVYLPPPEECLIDLTKEE